MQVRVRKEMWAWLNLPLSKEGPWRLLFLLEEVAQGSLAQILCGLQCESLHSTSPEEQRKDFPYPSLLHAQFARVTSVVATEGEATCQPSSAALSWGVLGQ